MNRHAQSTPFDLKTTEFDEFQENFSFSATSKNSDIGKVRNKVNKILREMKILG